MRRFAQSTFKYKKKLIQTHKCQVVKKLAEKQWFLQPIAGNAKREEFTVMNHEHIYEVYQRG
jgi:hypothetical protein